MVNRHSTLCTEYSAPPTTHTQTSFVLNGHTVLHPQAAQLLLQPLHRRSQPLHIPHPPLPPRLLRALQQPLQRVCRSRRMASVGGCGGSVSVKSGHHPVDGMVEASI